MIDQIDPSDVRKGNLIDQEEARIYEQEQNPALRKQIDELRDVLIEIRDKAKAPCDDHWKLSGNIWMDGDTRTLREFINTELGAILGASQ